MFRKKGQMDSPLSRQKIRSLSAFVLLIFPQHNDRIK
jgi:hypothetical protein